MHKHADIVILGSGFAGSLTALVLQRLGRRPVLLERSVHPRFAIGESSTPLGNLALEELSRRYDLPRLFPLSEYGRWQKAYPTLTCGLKRGFSYFQHHPGEPFHATPDHQNELLVAASPADEVADTHWFREEFDHFLVREVQAVGIPYFERTEITAIEHDQGWHLRARRDEGELSLTASFLIDATGPGGVLAQTLGIPTDPAGIHTNCWSVYSHFVGVQRWQDILGEMNAKTVDYPFPCDDAALHHILPEGWIWVLRFNNGVTSAGIAFNGVRQVRDGSVTPEAVWQHLLEKYPSLGRQFARAERVQPWVATGRLQRRARRAVGKDWVLLPHAAYFLDPLFSPGIAHTIVGIQRLARAFEDPAGVAEGLAKYERDLFAEMEFLDWLIHGCYCLFGRFDAFCPYTMYYFAGAVQAETLRRTGSSSNEGFLYSGHPPFRAAVAECHDRLLRAGNSAGLATELYERVSWDIAGFNRAGFCDRAKHNMYPFV
jgi:FADH2 O2-dependent halogenase